MIYFNKFKLALRFSDHKILTCEAQSNIYKIKSSMEKNWSDEVKLGEYTLKNRIVLSALTRQRCDPEKGIPT